MSKRCLKNTGAELPEPIRAAIREDIDRGLARFRARDFENRLRDGFPDETEGSRRIAFAERPPRRWRRLAPAAIFGLVGAIVVAAAVLWLGRGPAPDSIGLDATLAGLPGFRTLENAPPSPAPPAGTPGPVEMAFFRSLAAAAAGAGAAEPDVRAPERIVPRYDLERKIEILTVEEPIERALELIMTKTKGGLTT